MSTSPTLVIMAAGAARRYGGLKQLAPVGPDGQALMEYSIYDAQRAGFAKVVLVVRREFEQTFRSKFADRGRSSIDIQFAYQDADAFVPAGYQSVERSKPWGTAHAVLCAKPQVSGSFAVINADDRTSTSYLAQINGPVLTIGMDSPAEVTGTLIERFISEQTFLLTAGSETVPVRTRMIGKHHVYNCLVAAAVGLAYGIDLATVVRGLEAVDHVPGRLQRLECGQPFGVFVDYAHTPDALAGSLRALRDVTEGRLICLFGAGGDRDRRKRPLMAAAVQSGADGKSPDGRR